MKVYYSSEISWQLVDDTVYIIDGNQVLYGLQEVGREFWILVDSNYSVERIIQILSSKYNEKYEVIRKDILELVDDLVEKSFLIKNRESN